MNVCAICRINPVSECEGWPVPALYCGSCMSFSAQRVKANAGKPPEQFNPVISAALQHGLRLLLPSTPKLREAMYAAERRRGFSVIEGGRSDARP